jgi:hypothetical protein
MECANCPGSSPCRSARTSGWVLAPDLGSTQELGISTATPGDCQSPDGDGSAFGMGPQGTPHPVHQTQPGLIDEGRQQRTLSSRGHAPCGYGPVRMGNSGQRLRASGAPLFRRGPAIND